jgi:hypothetical protein
MKNNVRTLATIFLAGCIVAGCSRTPDSDVSPEGTAPDSNTVPTATTMKPQPNAKLVKIGYVKQADTMDAGSTSTYSISIENGSGFPLASTGANSTYITYHWLADAGGGGVDVWNNARTPIEQDIAEGATATSAFPVAAPKAPGHYILKVVMGINGGLDFETSGQSALHYKVTVK